VKTLIDGKARSQVSALDRGLLFGDGLFETMAFARGRCPLWERHMQRLLRGCRMLGLPSPDVEQIDRECRQLAGDVERSVIRLTLTRGSGGRGYWPDPEARPTRIVQRRDWPEAQTVQYRTGLKAMTSSLRISIQPALTGLKHSNRLEQVLAARECQQFAVDEALVFDQNGFLAEAVSSNLLLRIDGQWTTPSSPAAVAGVGLEWLVDASPLPIEARAIDGTELARADSILVINSVGGIRPLRCVDQRQLVIDEDCRRLQRLWNQELVPVCDDC
jgi:4-amino-4-deoxychorismate lyase